MLHGSPTLPAHEVNNKAIKLRATREIDFFMIKKLLISFNKLTKQSPKNQIVTKSKRF